MKMMKLIIVWKVLCSGHVFFHLNHSSELFIMRNICIGYCNMLISYWDWLGLGVGKRVSPPRVRSAYISPHWQRTGPTCPAFLHWPNKLVCPHPVDPAGQTGRFVGLVLPKFKIQVLQFKANDLYNKKKVISLQPCSLPFSLPFFLLSPSESLLP